jgi:hypothetical protein
MQGLQMLQQILLHRSHLQQLHLQRRQPKQTAGH